MNVIVNIVYVHLLSPFHPASPVPGRGDRVVMMFIKFVLITCTEI